MSSIHRLKAFAEQVCEAGLAGKSMQDKLAELVAANDFSTHEIERIAQMANRQAQLGFQKSAKDKRVKFALCDAKPLAKQARKQAVTQFSAPSDAQKIAQLTSQMGDPFRAPSRSNVADLSIMREPLNEALVLPQKLAEIKTAMIDLDRLRLEYEATNREGSLEIMKCSASAEERFKAVVQAAMDMVMSGVTVPSLYEAAMAGVEGTRATPQDRENIDHLMAMIIEGLKQRGVPNHRMGFRYQADKRGLDALDTQQLVARCRFIYYRQHPVRDLDARDVHKYACLKQAACTEELVTEKGPVPTGKGPMAGIHEATDFLNKRPTIASAWDAQAYLDDPDNIPESGIRVINGQNEFIIGITDLVGTQARVWRARNAQEYLGLKLKEIEQLLTELAKAKETVAGALEKRATGNADSVLAAGARELGTTVLSTKGVESMRKRREPPRATHTLSGGEEPGADPNKVALAKISGLLDGAAKVLVRGAKAVAKAPVGLPADKTAGLGDSLARAGSGVVNVLGHPALGNAIGLASIGMGVHGAMSAMRDREDQERRERQQALQAPAAPAAPPANIQMLQQPVALPAKAAARIPTPKGPKTFGQKAWKFMGTPQAGLAATAAATAIPMAMDAMSSKKEKKAPAAPGGPAPVPGPLG